MAALTAEQQDQLIIVGIPMHKNSSTNDSTSSTTDSTEKTEESEMPHHSTSGETRILSLVKTRSGTESEDFENSNRKLTKSKTCTARIVYRVCLLSSSSESKVDGIVQVISDPIRCSELILLCKLNVISIIDGDCNCSLMTVVHSFKLCIVLCENMIYIELQSQKIC